MNPGRIKSKLTKPVQELIELIYNVEAMKQAMLDFNIDLRKMPIEKINRPQLSDAYNVLKYISGLIDEFGLPHEFVEASDRFYDLIPHHFGIMPAPIINSDEAVHTNFKMLMSLRDIKFAYDLLNIDIPEEENRLDALYKRLNCDIYPVSKESNEFEMVGKYVKSSELRKIVPTQQIEIDEIFEINRISEKQRFEPYENDGNRQLLWYGSRTINFVRILKKGLNLDPPKYLKLDQGIFFRDMASKALNDCGKNSTDDTCLMLLCEVALGEPLEFTGIENLADGPSIKVIGKTYLDPKNVLKLDNGVIIPIGKLVTDPTKKTQFQHNEYIVANPAQTKCIYLVRGKVKWN